jgi:hypothetical protein
MDAPFPLLSFFHYSAKAPEVNPFAKPMQSYVNQSHFLPAGIR